jgi:hypothetical protein
MSREPVSIGRALLVLVIIIALALAFWVGIAALMWAILG